MSSKPTSPDPGMFRLTSAAPIPGGQVENGLSKARTTHLVSARDRGVKVVRAEECHIPVVTAAWLYDMAKSGSISSVESFRIQPSVLDASQSE